MVSIRDIKFSTYLKIISVLGFLTIIAKSALGFDIGLWVEGVLFVLIGLFFAVRGGYHLIFKRFKDGLTNDEVVKISTVVLGFSSIFVGILTAPIVGFTSNLFPGIKTVIAVIAIIVIIFE